MKNVFTYGLILFTFAASLEAKEPPYKGKSGKSDPTLKVMEELCTPATAQSDLSINNVRATILAGGDMWWDLNQARYEVPKGGGRHSMFAGALWLGGVDEGNQLKLAAMTYRSRGNDYWTGPLTSDGSASVDKSVCDKYDRHWFMYREEVEVHRAWLECKDDPNCDESKNFPGYSIPLRIQEWPGNGVEGELPYVLAPFVDRDGDLVYDPTVDYPAYDLDKSFDCTKKEVDLVYGDETIWWVYNDRGNVHTETQAGALGFEIRAQAFAFSTNDEVNNMTFNNYRILNKSTFRLTNTFFSTWFDPDLGNYLDDIIGCDIPRGLGYCYNGDADDEGAFGYGTFPPAVGFDFFQGPFADYFDGLDNDRDGCPDGVRDPVTGLCRPEDPLTGLNERIIMSGFMYYNNGGTTNIAQTSDPDNAAEFYNYMRNLWKNGNPLVVETPSGPFNPGNGDGFTNDGSGQRTLYAYPGSTFDTTGITAPVASTNWYESPNNQADKRGLHSAGPFSLAPGALNFITTGVVWARDFTNSDPFASVDKVIIADDKAQNLFDNCFQVLDGPTAPDMEIVELDRELVITLTNPSTSNNFGLGYYEFDPTIPPHVGNFNKESDSLRYYNYVFEGYQVFQLANANVTVSDIYDPSLSRLVAQCDIENGITKIINYTRDDEMEADVPQLMTLQYNNEGVQHSFRVLEDAFAEGDRRLVNNKEYYFTVVAYGHNDYSSYVNQAPSGTNQKVPYIAGRLNNLEYLAIPHLTSPEQNGLVINAQYGDGVDVKRVAGMGNSGRFIDITESDKELIVRDFQLDEFTYEKGFAPVDLKVVDPKRVPAGDYVLEFDTIGSSARWRIYDITNGAVLAESDTTLAVKAEQIIPELGMSLTVEDVLAPGNDEDGIRNNGVIGGEILFEDPQIPWLTFIPDGEGYDAFNWILAGPNTNGADGTAAGTYGDYGGDPLNFFGNIVESQWGPYAYASHLFRAYSNFTIGYGPALAVNESQQSRPNIQDIHSVDVVVTSDRTKWTRVPVFEMGEDPGLTVGNVEKWRLRQGTSYKLQGDQLIEDPNLEPGWSYFPGYAVDVETGQRLCMAFGENSWLISENGADMLWNPTSTVFQVPANSINGGLVMGGLHNIYVFAPSLREGLNLRDITYKGDAIDDFPLKDKIDRWIVPDQVAFNRSLMWTAIPRTERGYDFVDPYSPAMPSDVTIKLRMDRPFERYETDPAYSGFPRYEFSTKSIAARANDVNVAENALDLIRVVPNPYYASSYYEDSQLDNIVKITNLPERCTISIYGLNGTRVRQIRKDNTLTFVEWDLRNNYNVPISSGVYILHIDAGELGEKVVKWFGTMRPVDLNSF